MSLIDPGLPGPAVVSREGTATVRPQPTAAGPATAAYLRPGAVLALARPGAVLALALAAPWL